MGEQTARIASLFSQTGNDRNQITVIARLKTATCHANGNLISSPDKASWTSLERWVLAWCMETCFTK
jgi:hypothetical protein